MPNRNQAPSPDETSGAGLKKSPLAKLFLTGLVLFGLGCSRGPRIRSHPSISHDSRVLFLILHYTGGNFNRALRVLSQGEFSSHYLLKDQPAEIYRLVPEDRRAFHAGQSSWKEYTFLNASSIGIELANPGVQETPEGAQYHDYPKAQIDALIPLIKDIVARHHIRPEYILGHNEIAPLRKVDPGPNFPWKRLAEEGLIPWPDPIAVAAAQERFQTKLPDIPWFQAKLNEHGYSLTPTGALDEPTRKTLAVFQMRYRPTRYDGTPDAETAAILEVITQPGKK